MTAARKKAAAAKEDTEKDVALKRARDERKVGLRDYGGKGGLSNLNDPKDPKRVTVVKATVLPEEDHDLTSAALPKSRIPPAPALQGQQASGGGEDMSVNEPQRGRERGEDAAPQAAQVFILERVIFQRPPPPRPPSPLLPPLPLPPLPPMPPLLRPLRPLRPRSPRLRQRRQVQRRRQTVPLVGNRSGVRLRQQPRRPLGPRRRRLGTQGARNSAPPRLLIAALPMRAIPAMLEAAPRAATAAI